MSAHAPEADPRIPRGALFAAAALLVAAIAAAAAVRLSGVEIRAPDAAPVVTRALKFVDLPDGDVAVIDARDGSTIETVTGESGFFRGTLRGLARERKRAGFGPEIPFDLVARADGRLTLIDPATGRRVDLESFGPVNAAVFARLLPTPPNRP